MLEIIGLILGVIGVLFAFEAPRRNVVGLFSTSSSTGKNINGGLASPVIDLCHRGISVNEIEPDKLHFDIPYCAGKNANAHNVKLQSAIYISEGLKIKLLSSFGDDFPERISLTYEMGKSISYTLSPLAVAAIPYLYIVIRGTYTDEAGEKIIPVLDIFKFSAISKEWVRTLGEEDKKIRALVRAEA